MSTELEVFTLANLCMYAYKDRQTLSDVVFRDGLMLGSCFWRFDQANFIENEPTDMQCYLLASANSREIAIVFRGTNSLTNWFFNMQSTVSLVSWPPGQEGSRVGEGWLTGWNSIKGQVKKRLLALLESSQNPTIYVTGHSLGGALAMIAAADLWENILSKHASVQEVSLITFATPVVGNAAFLDYFQKPGSKLKDYRIYHDPNDPIILANRIMLATINYSELRQIHLTQPGSGHPITNYVHLTHPKSTEYRLPARPNGDEPPRALAPDDEIKTLTVGTAVSGSFYRGRSAPPPVRVWLQIGTSPDGSGGVELPLYDGTGAYFVPGELRHQRFEITQGLRVSDLKNCRLKFKVVSSGKVLPAVEMPGPIVLDGFQLIVNGFSMMTDFTMGATVGFENPEFAINVSIPHYIVVGGRMLVTNKTSTDPQTEVASWGSKTDKEITVTHGYGHSEKYKEESYCYASIYVQRAGEEMVTNRRLIGGQLAARDKASKDPTVIISEWGERSDTARLAWTNYGYSKNYHQSYLSTLFFLSPEGAAPVTQASVIGGRMIVNNSTSSGKAVETHGWGDRSANEYVVSQGYCYSDAYGKDSYFYTSFFTDKPIPAGVADIDVELVSVICIRPQEYGGFQTKDEIYLKKDGQKVWPAGNYTSIGPNETVNVNIGFVVGNAGVRWELWDKDDITADDLLYEFFFTNGILAYDQERGTSLPLRECEVGRQYLLYGRAVDASAVYRLLILVRGKNAPE